MNIYHPEFFVICTGNVSIPLPYDHEKAIGITGFQGNPSPYPLYSGLSAYQKQESIPEKETASVNNWESNVEY